MLMIVLSALLTVSWAVTGVYYLSQPVISHTAYACVWSLCVLFNGLLTINFIRKHAEKRKSET